MAKCDMCGTETDASQCPQCGSIVTLPPSNVLKNANPFSFGKLATGSNEPRPAKVTKAEPGDNIRKLMITLNGGPLDGKTTIIDIVKGGWPTRFTTVANEQVRACVYALAVKGGQRIYQFLQYAEEPKSK